MQSRHLVPRAWQGEGYGALPHTPNWVSPAVNHHSPAALAIQRVPSIGALNRHSPLIRSLATTEV